MTMFRPTRGARVSQPARTAMPGSSWNPTSIGTPQPMPRQNPGVQTTNPGGGSVMDGGAPRQPSENAQLSSGFQREQPPQPSQARNTGPVSPIGVGGAGAMIEAPMPLAGDGTMNNAGPLESQALPMANPPDSTTPAPYTPTIEDVRLARQSGNNALASVLLQALAGNLTPADAAQVLNETGDQALANSIINFVLGKGWNYTPAATPPDNTTPAPNLPQPPMRYRPTGPSPDKGTGGAPARPQQPAPMQTQLPGDYNPAAGTIYDRPGMGPGYGAQPPLQRAADIDYAAPQPPRRYTVRTPGVNRTTGNGIFTGR